MECKPCNNTKLKRKKTKIKDVLSFYNLLLNWCYLPPCDGWKNRIKFHLTGSQMVATSPLDSRVFCFSGYAFVFYFTHCLNNQFVDSMYNEFLSLSNINRSLLFRLAVMLLTQLYIHFAHMFSEKKSICYKVWHQCNHSSKVHFRTMCMRLQYSCTTTNRRTLKLRSFCSKKKCGLYNVLNLHKQNSTRLCSLFSEFFFFLLFFFLCRIAFLLQTIEENHCNKGTAAPCHIWNHILWKTPAHCAVVYTLFINTGT